MAVRHGYGKIAGADALVFAYDTGDTSNSYKGEPTTNLNTVTLSTLGTDGSGQGSVGTRTILSPNHVRIVDVNSNTRQSQVISGLTGGTIYTISVEYKKLSGTPTFRFQIQDYSGGTYLRTIKFTNTAETGIVDKDGWQTASWTFTLGTDANAVRIWYQDGADYTTYTHSFELRNPQLEAKSHATPFAGVGGTRSTTQGLLDLTGRNSIDLSNASFNSDAQIEFDGTDSYIQTNFGDNITSEFTAEFIFYGTTNQTHFPMQMYVSADSNTVFRVERFSAGADSIEFGHSNNGGSISGNELKSFNFPNNTWHHCTLVYDGSFKYIYKNGSLDTSVADSTITWYSGAVLRIGARQNSSLLPLAGFMPMVKIYNRALTAAEVKNNYNNYKGRFDI
jgi:hypothetical protein